MAIRLRGMSDPLAPADPADPAAPAVPEAGDRSPVSSADVDTQFDLDLSAELEQYPDPSWGPAAAGTDSAAVPTEVAAGCWVLSRRRASCWTDAAPGSASGAR